MYQVPTLTKVYNTCVQGRCSLFQCFSPYDNTRVSTGREELFLTNCRPVYFVSVRCYVAVVSVSVDVQYGNV